MLAVRPYDSGKASACQSATERVAAASRSQRTRPQHLKPHARRALAMGKSKKEDAPKTEEAQEEGASYETKKKYCSVIANPLADEKLCKKVLKLCKKASKRKAIRRGVKEVVKALRKKQKGCVTTSTARGSRQTADGRVRRRDGSHSARAR